MVKQLFVTIPSNYHPLHHSEGVTLFLERVFDSISDLKDPNLWEKDYLNQSRDPRHRLQRTCVCLVIRKFLGVSTGEYDVVFSPHFFLPQIKIKEKMYSFSLANKEEFVFIGFTENESAVGVDLEIRNQKRDWASFNTFYFHYLDIQLINTLSEFFEDDHFAYLVLFVAKESCLKKFNLKLDPLDIFFELKSLTQEGVHLSFKNQKIFVAWDRVHIFSTCT